MGLGLGFVGVSAVEATDHELLTAAGRGEPGAFAELVHRYQRLVRWRLAGLVPPDQVDDLAQEVFVELAKALLTDAAVNHRANHVASSITSLAAWLVTVARRKAANFFRSNQRYDQLLANYQRQVGESAAGQQLLTERVEPVHSSQLEALVDCLARLQPKYREIVDGYYAHGQSAEVLAVQTGRTPGAIRMILMRVRRSLAKCMARNQKPESSGPNS